MERKRGWLSCPVEPSAPWLTLVFTTPPTPALSSERICSPPACTQHPPPRLHEANRHRRLYIFHWESAGPAQN